MSELFYKLAKRISLQSFVTVFKLSRDESHYFKGEAHDFWEIVYMVDGRAEITKGDKIYKLNPGEMVAHPPMEFHSFRADGEAITFIIISFQLDGDTINSLGRSKIKLSPDLQKDFISLFYEISDSFVYGPNFLVLSNSGSDINENIITLKFETFLLELLKSVQDVKPISTTDAIEYKRVIRVLSENIDKSLSVPEIAKLSSLSVSTLKRIFKKYTCGGANEHFIRLKLIQATKLLDSGMNVNEVSEKLGFSSPSYFSRTFSRYMGVPPKEFKKTGAQINDYKLLN